MHQRSWFSRSRQLRFTTAQKSVAGNQHGWTDAAHSHIHILANRVTFGGQVVRDAHDYKRQEPIMRSLEQRFGLQHVTLSNEVSRAALRKGEVEKQEEARIRNSQELIKLLMKLNNAISQATSSVQESACEVRATPANVIGQFSEQMRQCLSACEAASNRTRENYEKTAKLLAVLDDGQIKVNILVGVLSTFVCAVVMVALPRVVAWLSN